MTRFTAGNTDPNYNIVAQGTAIKQINISILPSNAVIAGASANIFSAQYTGQNTLSDLR